MREYFGALLGNEEIKTRLGEAVICGRLPHAFLIDGPLGSGKFTLALEISAALNCEMKADKHSPLPCHKCDSCRRIHGGGFTDVKVLKKKDGKATIGTDEVKELRRDMFLSATEADYKVYIIKNAERMTPEAQNALLIVLEEPPKNVVIILLTEAMDKILSTIRSRSQNISMCRFAIDELDKHLSSVSPEYISYKRANAKNFRHLLVQSDGRIGRALELLDPRKSEDCAEEYSKAKDIIRSVGPRVPYTQLYSAVTSLSGKRQELGEELELVMNGIRDMIAAKQAKNFTPLFFTSVAEAENAGAGLTVSKLLHIFDALAEAFDANYKNANITALITVLAGKIKNS